MNADLRSPTRVQVAVYSANREYGPFGHVSDYIWITAHSAVMLPLL
jgi:hypothetical protein